MEFYHSLRSLPLLVYCPNGLIKAVETFLTHRHNTFNTIFGHPKEGRISKLDSGGLINQGMYTVAQEIMS